MKINLLKTFNGFSYSKLFSIFLIICSRAFLSHSKGFQPYNSPQFYHHSSSHPYNNGHHHPYNNVHHHSFPRNPIRDFQHFHPNPTISTRNVRVNGFPFPSPSRVPVPRPRIITMGMGNDPYFPSPVSTSPAIRPSQIQVLHKEPRFFNPPSPSPMVPSRYMELPIYGNGASGSGIMDEEEEKMNSKARFLKGPYPSFKSYYALRQEEERLPFVTSSSLNSGIKRNFVPSQRLQYEPQNEKKTQLENGWVGVVRNKERRDFNENGYFKGTVMTTEVTTKRTTAETTPTISTTAKILATNKPNLKEGSKTTHLNAEPKKKSPKNETTKSTESTILKPVENKDRAESNANDTSPSQSRIIYGDILRTNGKMSLTQIPKYETTKLTKSAGKGSNKKHQKSSSSMVMSSTENISLRSSYPDLRKDLNSTKNTVNADDTNPQTLNLNDDEMIKEVSYLKEEIKAEATTHLPRQSASKIPGIETEAPISRNSRKPEIHEENVSSSTTITPKAVKVSTTPKTPQKMPEMPKPSPEQIIQFTPNDIRPSFGSFTDNLPNIINTNDNIFSNRLSLDMTAQESRHFRTVAAPNFVASNFNPFSKGQIFSTKIPILSQRSLRIGVMPPRPQQPYRPGPPVPRPRRMTMPHQAPTQISKRSLKTVKKFLRQDLPDEEDDSEEVQDIPGLGGATDRDGRPIVDPQHPIVQNALNPLGNPAKQVDQLIKKKTKILDPSSLVVLDKGVVICVLILGWLTIFAGLFSYKTWTKKGRSHFDFDEEFKPLLLNIPKDGTDPFLSASVDFKGGVGLGAGSARALDVSGMKWNVDWTRVLDYIDIAQKTYAGFDWQNLECQKRVLCELAQDKSLATETGRKITNNYLLSFMDMLNGLPIPQVIQAYLNEYKEAISMGKNTKKTCGDIYGKCKFSLAQVVDEVKKKKE